MTHIERTDSTNPDFIGLVTLLDADLAERDGKDHLFYAQFNKTDKLKNAIVLYNNQKPVACGAMKEFAPDAMEVKRMYTLPPHRGHGFAGKILSELEKWAIELGCGKCVLETGRKQPEAISLYTRHGYDIIPNYGQYAGVDNSVCFEKLL